VLGGRREVGGGRAPRTAAHDDSLFICQAEPSKRCDVILRPVAAGLRLRRCAPAMVRTSMHCTQFCVEYTSVLRPLCDSLYQVAAHLLLRYLV